MEARRLLARRELERRLCKADPARLMSWMTAPETRDTEGEGSFSFAHMRDDASAAKSGWGWQREYFLWLYRTLATISYKARQLGLTWLGVGTLVVDAVLLPGSEMLVFRQKEKDAWKNVQRAWLLYESLPSFLRFGSWVEKPSRIPHPIPTAEFRLRFPDGRSSVIWGMSSGASEGHGDVVRRVLLDEYGHMDNAADVLTGVSPALGQRGHLNVTSTANGVSDEDTGEGNQFHRLWAGADRGVQPTAGFPHLWAQDGPGDNGFEPRFLAWSAHPDRDERWYETAPEVRRLSPHKRAEQYPSNPEEGFTLSNRVFFDPEDLAFYAKHRRASKVLRGDFEQVDSRVARFVERSNGRITVFEKPVEEHSYAIGADVATGRGLDYSAAYVVDLATMELAAEFHARLEADRYAEQLHYLGRWYHTAEIAVEVGGGYGEAVNIALKDGKKGRPPYPRLYRHVMSSRPDRPLAKPYGFPTNAKTRPLIVNQLERALRARLLPALPGGLLAEMQTFVHHDSGPSPAAQQGTRDDRVMAACIALELYRLRGEHPDARRRGVRRPPPRSPYPWLGRAAA